MWLKFNHVPHWLTHWINPVIFDSSGCQELVRLRIKTGSPEAAWSPALYKKIYNNQKVTETFDLVLNYYYDTKNHECCHEHSFGKATTKNLCDEKRWRSSMWTVNNKIFLTRISQNLN